jgi:hypothetical protein
MKKLFILVLAIPRSICNKMFFIKFVPLVFSFKESNYECNTCPSIKMYLVSSTMNRSLFIKLDTLKKVRIFLFFWLGIFHYEKKRCFAIGLATQFLNCKGHLQLTIYIVQFIAIQLQLYQNNSFSTTMQLHYDFTHDIMLMSLIVIHLLKFDT